MRTNNRVHDHLHGLCWGTVIYIDRLTILMADHSACHQIVAMHTNIQKTGCTHAGGPGGNTGTVPETGLKTATDRSWGNHGKITFLGRKVKRCDFRWEWTKIDSQPGTVAGEAPPGTESPSVRPSVRLFSLQGGV